MEDNKLPYHNQKNFKVPEDYFETLEDRIMQSVTSSNEKDLLSESRDPGFKVPDNYFENFENRLFKAPEKKKKNSGVISLLNKEMFYYAVGAAAVFVALISTVFHNPVQPVEFGDLDMITLESYLEESLDPDVSQYLSEEEAYLAPAENADVDFEAVYEYLNETVDEPAALVNQN